MNFTPVLDELLICQIASTHHENTEFDHCFSPVAMGRLCYRLDQITERWSGGCILPASPAGPGRCGPGRFWASGRYEQVIDRVDERCQINRRARGNDLAVGDRGFINEGRAGIFQVRLDAPPAGGALAASQSGIRKDPSAVADRGDDLTRRRLLNEAGKRIMNRLYDQTVVCSSAAIVSAALRIEVA